MRHRVLFVIRLYIRVRSLEMWLGVKCSVLINLSVNTIKCVFNRFKIPFDTYLINLMQIIKDETNNSNIIFF